MGLSQTQHVLDDAGDFLDALDGILDRLGDLRLCVGSARTISVLFVDHLQARSYVREGIVDFVGQSRCQGSECDQVVVMTGGRLGTSDGGNVTSDSDNPLDAPGVV